MARQIFVFTITIPPGTTKTAPHAAALAIPTRQVDEVEVLIPPGPAGTSGFAFTMSGTPIIPYNPGQWIVSNDEVLRWPLDGYPDSGAWGFLGYNLGAYPHSYYVRLLTSMVADSPTPAPSVIPNDLLSSSGLMIPTLVPAP